ncbi:MAG: hypothetical protein ABIT58_09930, partial [Ferruginibacter sp.]
MLKKIIVHPFTLFLACSLMFFWPVSLFLFSLKNDALTYYYPIRTLIADALRNGELPLWTPFINMGYPLHADMQSGAWNPVIWIFSFISNYSLAAFHCELLFYIAMAGTGFYYLCRNFGFSKTVACTMAFAYQFSGFMVDSVQFFTCISAACYLPWIILFFRKMCMQNKVTDAILLALFLYLSFTGGYPSLFIITGYILAIYFLFMLFSNSTRINFLKKTAPNILLAFLSFSLLSLPALVSFIQHLPMISRGSGQTLSFVLENSMNPGTTASLLTPFATTGNNNFLESSILMRNIYIGIVPLLFFIFAFMNGTIKKNKEMLFFFVMATIMIGMAWGKFFFMRQAAYYVLPFMNSFRHPALFRLFSIFFMLMIAASSLNKWEQDKKFKLLTLKKWILALLAISMLLGIGSFIFLQNVIPASELKAGNFRNLLSRFNFQQRYLVQLPFLITTLLLSYFAIVKRKRILLICFVTLADLFFATQLNMPVTVIGSKKYAEVKTLINRNPVGFPIPGNESIEANSKNSSGENVITGSTLPFTKKIGRNDYFITPGNLASQDRFYESGIRDLVFKNPVLYIADTIIK